MIVYYDETTGLITYAIEAIDPNTVPPNNPGTPLYLDDTQYASLWNNGSPLIHEYLIKNNVPVAAPPVPEETLLSNAQVAQIAQLQIGLSQTLVGGFTAKTIVGTATSPHTYPTDANAQSNFSAVINAFTANPNKTSVTVQTLDAGWVSHTKTEFYGVYSDGDTWKEAQYAQFNTLKANVEAATTVSAVQAIIWAPATY